MSTAKSNCGGKKKDFKTLSGYTHFLMVLISEVKEPGDVEAQLGHILQEKKHQAHSSQAAQ